MATTKETLLSMNIPQFIVSGMNINGSYYHPTFLYESLWNIIGFVGLLVVRRLVKNLKTDKYSINNGKFITFHIGKFIAKVEVVKKLKIPT